MPLPQWLPDIPSPEDLNTFRSESIQDSIFDPMKLRHNLWESVQKGEANILCKRCSYAKVLWIQPKGTKIEPPWEEWSKVFQWLGYAPQGEVWRVFWFPAHMKRILPPRGEQVGPQHLNGGYCYPCNPRVIVVYRFEEATRVLLHELLHASCTDPTNASLPMKEATTETWAELMLVALCSRGNEKKAKRLWKVQSQWIANQNELLRHYYNIQTEDDYAWRYTVGRELILENLKIHLPEPFINKSLSSRLTHPDLCD